ncbi:MAG: DUF5668 domain-containing protein [Candidatus Bipolaricaulia bacterium]
MKTRRLAEFLLPLLVLGAGVVLLLNTLDVVTWAVWQEIARFWPVLLIAIGLSAILRSLRGGSS